MIQTTSKLKSVVAFLLMVALVAPTLAFAESGSSTDSDKKRGLIGNMRERVMERKVGSTTASSTRPNKGVGGQNFCANIDKFTTQIGSQFDKMGDKRGEKMEEHKGIRAGKLDDRRDDRDENKSDRYTKLAARATTTEQATAVAAFKTAIDAATLARRTAVDAAVAAFKTGSDALLAERKAKVDAAKATLKTSTDAAIAKAKADCLVTGANAEAIRTALKDALKMANDAFRATIKPTEDADDKVKVLRQTRDAAIKAANEAFNTAAKAALAALKLALGK